MVASSIVSFDGLFWLLVLLLPLLFFRRQLHREMVSVFLLITRRLNISLILYSLLFFPGVVVHELSHWITARLLGVRTGKVSLIPERLEDGTLRMGYVEADRVDFLRDALVGAAPLIFGVLLVGYVGLFQLQVHELWGATNIKNIESVLQGFSGIYDQSDFWVWFYLLFVISSTMFPSASDRRAWLSVLLFTSLLLGFVLLIGAGPWLLENAAPSLNAILQSIAIVFGISLAIHTILLVPTWLFRRFLNRLTGLKVN